MLLAVLFVAAIGVWLSRESIADDFISGQLDQYDIPATYEIERIGGRTQVLTNVVLGDANDPDFTAERMVIDLRHRFGLPEIAGIRLFEPRIYGSYRDGELSFGSLDTLLFQDTDEAAGLPNINLAIRDGRGLIETDYGPVGLKIAGSGLLSHGFEGIFAATAPELQFAGCQATGATLYGEIASSTGEPEFSGPGRLASLACGGGSLAIRDYTVNLDARTNDQFENPSFEARIDGGNTRFAANVLSALTGTIRGRSGDNRTLARFTLAGRGLQTSQALAAVVTAEGQLRANEGFASVQLDSAIEANGLRLGPALEGALASLSSSGEDTLLAPLADRIASTLRAQTRGSALRADLRARYTPDGYSLVVPTAELRGGGGARIASLSRVEIAAQDESPPRIAGNIAIGGSGLPRITGRMERVSGGDPVFRLAMERYEAGKSALAIPQLVVTQGEAGAFGFSGRAVASGPIPGGSVDRLRVPLAGRWEPGGMLALWRNCTEFGFDRLQLADLQLDGRDLRVCPPRGLPILRYGEAGLQVAAGAPSLDLSGTLGSTPIRVSSGPVGFGYPGDVTAREAVVSLGPIASASEFRISELDARFGNGVSGEFSGAEVRLNGVPLDVSELAGRWGYSDGRLSIDDASFVLTDREEPDRFEPLVSSDGSLTLLGDTIEAQATLRNPTSERIVTLVDVRHDLATGSGYADLDVPGVEFDQQLQPDQLTRLALGVVANVDGVVTGSGRITWSPDGEVTSTGTFSSEDLDFAAAFGPVRGATGTVEFVDLLGLTTAPDQTIRVGSVNPGIEVLDGEVGFELRDGEVLAVSGGSWPFMGGRLILRDVDLNLGASEERRYLFEIVGLDAATFVTQMDLENISATGTFDGTVPIVFDAMGNGRIDTGILISRPPGGNISYVGELTYEDLSPIANFAFDSLKSLDYNQMRVVMEGPLTGEIITRVRFDGVSQGEGASSNFITRRLARLPLQFRINIRAQFYKLLTSLKSFYDPSAVRDPREIGLLSDDGEQLLRPEITAEEVEPDIEPEDIIPNEPVIQDQESE